MTITLTKRELLSLAFHVQPKPVQTMEQAKFRRQLWKAFDVADMAADVAELARSPRVNVSLDWLDRKESLTGEVESSVVDWLIGALKPPFEGPDADFLLDIHDKLTEAKAAL